MCAAQALDFLKEFKPGDGVEVAHKLVRGKISHLEKDRILHPDINLLKKMINSGDVLKNVEDCLGKLK